MKDSLPKLTEKAQKVFNAWVRRRDSYGDYTICISCGKSFLYFQMDAGHYVPVRGGSFLRLHEWNVNAECKGCNGFDDFHLVGYRKNLIEKIGLENVEWLEANRRTVKKWSRSELLEIIEKYKP
jgi:hypothetical protein